MRDITRLSLIIAVTYFAGALIGFQLALTPHSPITLFWPPAGVALAAVLLRGKFALPGIFAGAAAVNLLLLGDSPSWPVFIAGMVISASSSVAALLGGLLLRGFAPSAPVWSSARDLLIASLVMATVCVLPALLGGASLYASGQVPPGALGTTMAMWWLGDFCGMTIFTPMFYTIARRTTGDFWRPVKPEVIASTTALNSLICLVALGFFIALWSVEEQSISDALEREAQVSANSLKQSFQRAARDIESIRALITASDHRLDEEDFLQYASMLAGGHEGDTAAYRTWWAPRVTDRKSWEAQMIARNGADIYIFEVEPPDRIIKVLERPEYFPVHFIYSTNQLNWRATGFDLGSDPARRAGIELARDTASTSIAAPIMLFDTELDDRTAMQICLPAYRRGTPVTTLQERRDNFEGVACGIYQTSALISSAFAGQPEDQLLHLFDQTDSTSTRWVYTHNLQAPEEPPRVESAPAFAQLRKGAYGTANLRFGHRDWLLVSTPGPGLQSSMRSGIPWAAMILIIFLGIVGSSIMIERVLAHRRVDAEKQKTDAALAQARAANESKSYLMAAAGHDIKQPLFALGFLTDTLMMTEPPESTIPVLKYLKKNIREMTEHFDTLMDLGRFQQGGFEARNSVFTLSDLERRIALEIGPLCREKGLGWTIALDDTEIESDPELLLRMARNLLMNAVRYTDRGEVRFIAAKTGKTVEFRISDTGPGLTPGQQEMLFTESSLTADEEMHSSNLGMGFSIVNKISHALGLELELQTSEKGTTFSFQLPLAE